jgi:type IV pilus assembly protein PilA
LKRFYRGVTLVQLIIFVAIIVIVAAVYGERSYNEYAVRAVLSEIVLQASGYKTPIAEKAVKDGTLASSGKGLTVSTGGRVSGGSVTNAGVITVAGSQATIGTALTVILTPSLGAGGRLSWQCSTGHADQWRYVPAECRH